MSCKIIVDLTVRIVLDADSGVDVSNIIDELEYSFTDTTGTANVVDTTIENHEVIDSK